MKITVTNPSPQLKKNMGELSNKMGSALDTAARMAASMIEDKCRADISRAGNFGGRWTEGLHVIIEGAGSNKRVLSVTHDIPYADVFETGATISGNPLLWIGLSGTDAEGVAPKDYGGGLFSIRRPSGTPLLFSMSDKMPKYAGVPSVTIAKKFNFDDDITSAMADFPAIFATAWGV